MAATEVDLTRRWSLAPKDVAEVLRARGTKHRLRYAVQLCMLRATGRFVADYRRVPPEAVNHLAHQLGLDPLLFLPDPERPATESAQLHRIRQHLGWHEFDQAAEQGLRTQLQERAAEGMTPGPLLTLAENLLRSARVVLPAVPLCANDGLLATLDEAVPDMLTHPLDNPPSGVVQLRVTPKTRNPFTTKALSIFGVTWKWHF